MQRGSHNSARISISCSEFRRRVISVSVLLTGGSGRLGRAISSTWPDIFAPTRAEMDITNYDSVLKVARVFRPHIVIHSAALVGRRECDADPRLADEVNVVGTRNMMLACKELNAKLVFISTAAVFDGKKGNYSERDEPNPQYLYAETKLKAEKAVLESKNHLIIRTDFFDPTRFKYDEVFTDHFCSKEPTPVIAKKILWAMESGARGSIHIGGPRRSLFDVLSFFFPRIKPIRISESSMPDFPRDLSLSTESFPQSSEPKQSSSRNNQ
jgi:dTDP-4-dehydrorhamnose reductase